MNINQRLTIEIKIDRDNRGRIRNLVASIYVDSVLLNEKGLSVRVEQEQPRIIEQAKSRIAIRVKQTIDELLLNIPKNLAGAAREKKLAAMQ